MAVRVSTADAAGPAHRASQLRIALAEYVSAAIVDPEPRCYRLLQEERKYRASPEYGQSEFNKDKIHYDRVLLNLEHSGRRLNYLFIRCISASKAIFSDRIKKCA